MLIAGWDCSSGHFIRNRQAFPTLTLATSSDPGFQRMAEAIQQNLAALGISVKLDDNYSLTVFFDTYYRGACIELGNAAVAPTWTEGRSLTTEQALVAVDKLSFPVVGTLCLISVGQHCQLV